MINKGQAATAVWMNQVMKLGTMRDEVSPRGMRTKEIVGSVVEVNMQYPVVCCPQRKLGYNFMAAEALWIISGSNSLDFHPEIRAKLMPYSDDGQFMTGAYGPPFIQQLRYVVNALTKDRDSRQAVIVIFPRTPMETKDVPCTVAMQFMVRHDVLHTNVFMRSSDAWMGLPYDIFSFTMMSMIVAIAVGIKEMGRLHITMGSSHLYEKNWAAAQEVIGKWDWKPSSPWLVKSFHTADELMTRLRNIADSEGAKEWLEKGCIYG